MRVVVTVYHDGRIFEWVQGTDTVRVVSQGDRDASWVDEVPLAPGFGVEAVRQTALIYEENS